MFAQQYNMRNIYNLTDEASVHAMSPEMYAALLMTVREDEMQPVDTNPMMNDRNTTVYAKQQSTATMYGHGPSMASMAGGQSFAGSQMGGAGAAHFVPATRRTGGGGGAHQMPGIPQSAGESSFSSAINDAYGDVG